MWIGFKDFFIWKLMLFMWSHLNLIKVQPLILSYPKHNHVTKDVRYCIIYIYIYLFISICTCDMTVCCLAISCCSSLIRWRTVVTVEAGSSVWAASLSGEQWRTTRIGVEGVEDWKVTTTTNRCIITRDSRILRSYHIDDTFYIMCELIRK